jgi:hypothetical protein
MATKMAVLIKPEASGGSFYGSNATAQNAAAMEQRIETEQEVLVARLDEERSCSPRAV